MRRFAMLCLTIFVFAPVRLTAQVFPIAAIVADDSLATEPVSTSTPMGTSLGSTAALAGGHFKVSISRAAASPITVNYAVSGSASNGVDYPTLPGSVTIPAGATSAGIDILPIHDSQAERDEPIILKLTSGTGYSTLIGSDIARVTIVDSDRSIQITVLDANAAEPGVNTGTVQFDRLGTLRGRLAVAFNLGGSATDGVDVQKLPDSLVYADGQSSITLTVTPKPDNVLENSESILFRTAGVPFASTTGTSVSIADATVKVSTAIPSVVENQGNTANFIITRSGDVSAAAAVSYAISGTATNGVDFNTITTTVTIPAGSASATVPIIVKGDNAIEGAETIVLTVSGTSSLAVGSPNAATLVIDEAGINLGSLTLSPNTAVGGQSIHGTVQLNGQAPAGGAAVTLTLSQTATVATVSPTVVIPAGFQSADFTVTTLPVPNQTGVIVTAALGSGTSLSRQFTLSAPRIATYALSRSAVTPQATRDSTSVAATLTIDSPSPAGGLPFTLASSDPALVPPSTITVPAGQTSVTVPVAVLPVAAVKTANLTVSRNGLNSQSVSLTINPPAATTVALSPTQVVGQTDGRVLTTATVTLNAPSPATGLPVSVSRSTAQGALGTPVTLQVTAGTTTGSVGVTATPVAVATPVTVTAAAPGGSASATLTVNPPLVSGVTIAPDSVIGGTADANVTMQLGAPAAQGFVIPVASSDGNAFPCGARLPITSVTATAAATSVAFTVCTRAVTSVVNATISGGTFPAGTKGPTAKLKILPPIAIVLADNDVTGGAIGQQLTGTLVLPSAAEGTQSVTLTSSDGAAVSFASTGFGPTSSRTFNIPAGQNSVGFQLLSKAVATDRTVTFTATPGGSTATLLVRAPVVTVLNPLNASVNAGASRDLEISMNAPAPVGGLPVQINSSSAIVSVPSVVTVPKDSMKVKFAVTAQSVPTDADVSVTATTGTASKTLPLHVVGSLRVQSFTTAAASVAAGDSTLATLVLNAPAPAAGVSLPLTCANANVTIPSSLTIPAGQTTATFFIRVKVFGSNQVTSAFIATALGGLTPSVNVQLQPITLSMNTPNSIVAGNTVTGTLTANRNAPPAGFPITFTTSSPALSAPTTVTMPAGQSTTTFNITGGNVTASTIATLTMSFDQITLPRNITVSPQTIQSFTLTPVSAVGGSTVSFSVQLSAPATSSGQVIEFTASVAGVANIPVSITIPAGLQNANGQFSTVAVTTSTPVTITASLPGGGSSKQAFLTVNP